jgi:ADP-ribosylglycohydrolase
MSNPTHPSWRSKIRGCVLGASLGDAIGAPFEFQPVEIAPQIDGRPWIDGLYESRILASPHGVWAQPAPAGTGTDDTRYNWLFLELAIKLGRMPTADDMAAHFLDLYKHPDSVFPGHTEFTREQFEHWEGVCHGRLGQTSNRFPGLEPDELLGRRLGLNFPILSGLITVTSAGLLFPGQPESAYRQAFRTAFYDIGYAREAVGLLAAALSIAIAEDVTAQELFDRSVAMDPLQLGSEWSTPFVQEHLTQALSLLEASTDSGVEGDAALADRMSFAFAQYNTFDPFRTLGIAWLSVLASDGEPMRAMLMAANHVSYDESGIPVRFEDIDCYAGIAGALAGAIHGEESLPADLVVQVIESNKIVHGIDLDETLDRFVDCFHANPHA